MSVTKAFRDNIDRKLDDPEWALTIRQYKKRLSYGYYPRWEVDFVFQHPLWNIQDDDYSVFGFASIHALIASGMFVMCRVAVGAGPMGDKSDKFNNEQLSQIPKPFKAHFKGGNGDNDGFMLWENAVKMDCAGLDPVLADVTQIEEVVSARSVSLEVGYTMTHSTYLHLVHERGLARWMYGYNDLFVMVASSKGDQYFKSLLQFPYERQL